MSKTKKKFEYGDLVKLNKRGLRSWYATEDAIKSFERPSTGFDSREFVEFVHYQLGFENGKAAGLVTGDFGYDDCVKVKFFSPILGWSSAYYEPYYLDIVKKEDV